MSCGDDEFEPRITPKPAPKLDCFTVPSVPEVSLIFDKPYKIPEHTHLPFAESKDLTSKNNDSFPSNHNGSYAAWKEQNYLRKSSSSKVNDYITPLKEQCNQNYNAHSYLTKDNTANILNESKRKSYSLTEDIYNSSQCKQKTNKESNESPYKHNHEGHNHESSAMYTDKNTTVKNQCNNKIRHIDSLSATPHIIKPCKNADNYIVTENEYSPLLYERQLAAHSINQQKGSYNDSIPESNVQNLSINPNTLQRNDLQFPYYLRQQYPYFNMNAYSFPQLHPYPTNNTDNQETLKNLLQIINSQNEQIKSLQTQVDRLLKMQEETLKGRRCSCFFQSQERNTNSNESIDTSNYITVPENTRNTRESSTDKRKENCNKSENLNQNELILTDAQSKKAFMEQKVSIGVMTSFELTVQNNPFTIDIDNYEKKDTRQKQENFKMCNSVGLHDTNESLRRYKNSFTRIPAQLENIVEDSESYMSSSQQQSSNLNATTSTRDLEKQSYVDIRKETDTHISESPKLCKDVTTNKTEDRIKKHFKNCTEKTRNYENTKTPMIQRPAEYSVPKSRKIEANTITNINQDNKVNIRDNDFVKTNNVVNNSCYYIDCQQEGFKQNSNCIEDSLILNGDDLKINERLPSPEPSLHLEMQEYSSDDDSENVKRSSNLGWTLYNDVLEQVNQLLQKSGIIDEQQQKQTKVNQNERDEPDSRAALDPVKVATLEQLKKLGISLSENPEAKELNSSNKMTFDSAYYPRLDYQTNMTQATSAVNETNTSMHMKTLALKYLSNEQLAELAVQRQGASVKHLMVSNLQGTNMSFATMRYLERYQLVPGKNNIQIEDINTLQNEMSPKVDLKVTNPRNSPKHFPFNQTPRTTCPNKILDISALKQQPKLL